MNVHKLPETFPLDFSLSIKKNYAEDNKTKFLIITHEFVSDIIETLELYGISELGWTYSSSLLGTNEQINGLILSTGQVSDFRNPIRSSLNNTIERRIVEEGIVRELPVLFSKINFIDESNVDSNLSEQYLKKYFDYVYCVETSRKFPKSTGNFIQDIVMGNSIDKTSLTHNIDSHPILAWREQLSKTKKFSLKLDY